MKIRPFKDISKDVIGHAVVLLLFILPLVLMGMWQQENSCKQKLKAYYHNYCVNHYPANEFTACMENKAAKGEF